MNARNSILCDDSVIRSSGTPELYKELSLGARAAIAQLSTHFQPIFNHETKQVYGVEALARSDDGVFPLDLIARAKDEQWYDQLELAMLENAMKEAEKLPPDIICTLNISADAILSEEVRELLRRHGNRRWGFEILEYSDMHCADDLFRERIREYNCDLLIDDAGVGNSNVHRISSLRPTIVKIDRTVLVDAMGSTEERLRLQGIVQQSVAHGAILLAEGIETVEQHLFAQELGCTYLQGFYFGIPGPVKDVLFQVIRMEQYFIARSAA